jgi:hypothetical protein
MSAYVKPDNVQKNGCYGLGSKPLLAEDFADINMSVLQRERSGVYRGFLLVNHWFTKPDNFKLAISLKVAYFVNRG